MYSNRISKYEQLEVEYDGKVIAYITSDKIGFETQIAQDAIDLFIAQLDKIGSVNRIILYLYTRGGDTAAAWNIVNLLRMFCEEIVVIVPHKAHSAGTIISLGADMIIMTKQATLSPIDPSITTPFNPVTQGQVPSSIPVSVEMINGFLELAENKLKIRDDTSLADIMMKLSEFVHPLVLGQAYRTRAQIKMLASRLLLNQVTDQKIINKITDFLCSESGSHDYTINRREAEKNLGLNVKKPDDKQYKIIKDIYDDFSNELQFGKVFDPRMINGAYSIRRAFIESITGGSDYFITEGRIGVKALQSGQQNIINEKLFEGWRHDTEGDKQQTSVIYSENEEIRYEQDDNFSL